MHLLNFKVESNVLKIVSHPKIGRKISAFPLGWRQSRSAKEESLIYFSGSWQPCFHITMDVQAVLLQTPLYCIWRPSCACVQHVTQWESPDPTLSRSLPLITTVPVFNLGSVIYEGAATVYISSLPFISQMVCAPWDDRFISPQPLHD